jgi:hypothetical protein
LLVAHHVALVYDETQPVDLHQRTYRSIC